MEADDFEILLFSYSIDRGPVRLIDLKSQEQIPEEVLEVINNPNIIKHAWNCQFERICISAWLKKTGRDFVGKYLNPRGWQEDMVWAAYLGLPISLSVAGSVLKVQQQKMKEGTALIRYFCQPCKPTKANGGRTRNLPEDDPQKWEIFKSYNIRDVETELAITDRLKKFPVPDFLWEEFRLDQIINDRGVLLDLDFIHQAALFAEKSKADLTAKMKNLTRLENPNSVIQLKNWLSQQQIDLESLGKKDVSQLLEIVTGNVHEVL